MQTLVAIPVDKSNRISNTQLPLITINAVIVLLKCSDPALFACTIVSTLSGDINLIIKIIFYKA